LSAAPSIDEADAPNWRFLRFSAPGQRSDAPKFILSCGCGDCATRPMCSGLAQLAHEPCFGRIFRISCMLQTVFGHSGPLCVHVVFPSWRFESDFLQDPGCRANCSDAFVCSQDVLTRRQTMQKGTVKWFNPTKGYGFIRPSTGEKDVFVHISAVERAGLSTLNEGQVVEYELVTDRGKTSAENLKVA
jgi:CspA family cold shock protein